MDFKNDDDILRGVMSGDRLTIKWLYETLGPKIVGYVLNNSGSREDGQEVFQNTILRVFQNVKNGHYNNAGKFSPYFFTIAINVWHEELRYRKRQAHDDLIPEATDNTQEDHELSILKDKKLSALHLALQKIGEKCRELLQKFHFEDKASKELAIEYDIADNVVRKRLFDCREKLRHLTLAEMKK
jgi:RNA polymerase sigma factor (sigma-70 family)